MISRDIVPSTVRQAAELLATSLSDNEREYFRITPVETLIGNFGLALRQGWSLWEMNTPLQRDGKGEKGSGAYLEVCVSIATTAYSYDTANRLSKIEHRKGATVFNAHDYLFDRMSRIASVTSVDGKVDYSYDPLSQLLAATDPQSPDHLSSQAFSYTYDHNGNRNNTGYTAPTDDRVQTAPGGETYEYDLEGNLTWIAVGGVTSHLLTWDNRNRLTQAQVYWTGGSAIINYEYDAFNRLVKRTQSGNDTYWGYDEGINPHLQSDAGSISHGRRSA